MDKNLQEYRSQLVSADQKAQEDYDKTVLSLSGGALGISFAFVKEIVGGQPIVSSWLLLASWLAWGLSVTCVLASFYSSQQALRKAIRQVDAGSVREQTPGGAYSRITAALNALGGVLFLIGVIFIGCFAYYNVR